MQTKNHIYPLLLCLLGFFNLVNAQNVSIGEKEFTPNPAAILEIQSSSKGILIPRVSYTQRMYIPVNAQSSGLLLYQNDGESGFYYFDGLAWKFIDPNVNTNELPNLAKVATSGSYNDLIHLPSLPRLLSELEQSQTHRTVSDSEKEKWNIRSNFSGSYKDLSDVPELAKIALSGDYKDLQNSPPAISTLSQLEQSEYYRTVSDIEKTSWNTKSNFSGDYKDLQNTPSIPHMLRDLEQDYNALTVTEKEKEAWNTKSEFSGEYKDLQNAPTIPRMLRDLEQDYNNLTVSEKDKEKWNATAQVNSFTGKYQDLVGIPDFKPIATSGDYLDLNNRPSIPSALSQLEQNEYYRTVSETEKIIWNGKSNFSGDYKDLANAPFIPRLLRDLEQDYNTLTVTEKEKETWNTKSGFSGEYKDLLNPPFIPTKLSQLEQDGYNRTVTDQEKVLWNNKSTFSGSYTDLSDRPNISLSASTGNYNDLQNIPKIPSKLSDLESDIINRTVSDEEKRIWNAKSTFSGSYLELNNLPDFKAIATTADYNDLGNRPKILSKLSEMETDPLNRIVSDEEKRTWNAKSNFSGDYDDLSNRPILRPIASTAMYSDLINTPDIPSKLSELNDDEKHRLVTDQQVEIWSNKSTFSGSYTDLQNKPDIDELIKSYIERAFNKTLPIGTVVMWRGERIPECWTEVQEMRGLFPVGVGKCAGCDNADFFYEMGETGGKARVSLTTQELPSHSHGIWTNTNMDAAAGSKGEKIKANSLEGNSGITGGGQSHENRPPYYGIYFIQKTSDVCYQK